MHRIRGNLTYANVVATLALFLVLAGGTAFAAKRLLPKNSVGTKQIKDNAITGPKIKDGAVTGAKIQASSLGTVPSATTASHATSADTATRATTAANSDLLGGVSAAGFMPSSRFAYGAASTDSATRQPLFTLGGIEVTTSPSAGGVFRVSVKNLNARRWEFGQSNSEAVTVMNAGSSGTFADAKSRTMLISGVEIEDISKSIVIQCGSDNGPNLLFCFGQISPNA